MEELGFELNNCTIGGQKQTEYLYHACECIDAACRLPSCQKMKRRVQHLKSCKQRFNVGCPSCRQLISLCRDHAEFCQEAKCSVPFCVNIKVKLWNQQLRQILQKTRILNRHIATMENRGISGDVLQPSLENSTSSSQQVMQKAQILKRSVAAMQNRVLHSNLVNSSSSSQPSPQPHSSPYQPQPDTAIMEPIDLLPKIQQLKAEAKTRLVQNYCDNVQHLIIANFGKNHPIVNTGLIASNQQIQIQKPISQMSGLSNSMLNMGNVASRAHQNTQPLP